MRPKVDTITTNVEIIYTDGVSEQWLLELCEGKNPEEFFKGALYTVREALHGRHVPYHIFPSLKFFIHKPLPRMEGKATGLCGRNKRLIILWIGEEFIVTLFHELIHWFADTPDPTMPEERIEELALAIWQEDAA
ncbi:hypothetical protein ES703_10281 [subsurface metagenome]